MKPTEPEIDPSLPTTVTPSGRVVYDPLQARRVKVDGGAIGDMSQLLGELRALDDDHDVRDAVPAPVALAPSSGGALITQEGQDAASAHVEAPVPEPAAAGRVESSAVKIVDPRRAATVRIAKKSPWILDGGGAEPAIDKAALPSATAPSSRGSASSKRTVAVVVAGVVAAGLVAFFVLRAPPELPHESASGATSVPAPESATPGASATEAAPQPSAAGSTGVEPGTTAASPEATGSAPGTTAGTATSAKSSAPSTTSDPSADTSAAPKPTAGVGTAAPVVSAVPSVSPSAPPAVSSAPSSKPTGDDDFYIRSKKKKETANP